MKLSKKLFAAGVVAVLTLSVAASALAAELTVKTKKINEGQVKIATPVITGSEGGAKMDTLLTQMTTKNTVAEIYKYLSSDSQKITLDNYLDFTNGSPDPVKEGFALVKGSAFLVNAGFDKEQKALGKTQAAENTDWISTILLIQSIPKFYRWNNTPALIPAVRMTTNLSQR